MHATRPPPPPPCPTPRGAPPTPPHWAPIEPDTSRTSDKSTMRRCASPVAVTVTALKLASRMNDVGSTGVAETLTTLTPVAGMTVVLKNDGSLVEVTEVV